MADNGNKNHIIRLTEIPENKTIQMINEVLNLRLKFIY